MPAIASASRANAAPTNPMMNTPRLNARGGPYQPGDTILDRYMPDATPEEREAARENLKEFAELILRFCIRETERRREAFRKAKFDSPEGFEESASEM